MCQNNHSSNENNHLKHSAHVHSLLFWCLRNKITFYTLGITDRISEVFTILMLCSKTLPNSSYLAGLAGQFMSKEINLNYFLSENTVDALPGVQMKALIKTGLQTFHCGSYL